MWWNVTIGWLMFVAAGFGYALAKMGENEAKGRRFSVWPYIWLLAAMVLLWRYKCEPSEDDRRTLLMDNWTGRKVATIYEKPAVAE